MAATMTTSTTARKTPTAKLAVVENPLETVKALVTETPAPVTETETRPRSSPRRPAR